MQWLPQLNTRLAGPLLNVIPLFRFPKFPVLFHFLNTSLKKLQYAVFISIQVIQNLLKHLWKWEDTTAG